MPKESRTNNKAMIREWKEAQRALARREFPLSDDLLSFFFDQLDVIWPKAGCAHDLRSSEAIARNMGLGNNEISALLDWCSDHGGYCDCEVAANTRDYWKSNRERT